MVTASPLIRFVTSLLRIVVAGQQSVVEDLELDLFRLSLPLLLTCDREEL